jgi:hypothetical protein
MVSVASPLRRAASRSLGFSFIELIVIMGIVAVMAGLSVGWLQGAGRASGLVLARSQLLDAARRAQSRSMGGRLATLTFRSSLDENERPVQQVAVHVAETVLSHAFERLDGASGLLPMEVQGDVKVDPHGGRTGGGAVFGRGGVLSFPPQATFAVTEGLDMEVWLAPSGSSPTMVVLEGQGAYEVSLFRALAGGDYDVRLRVNLHGPDGRGDPSWTSFETEGAPVRATGRWVHLRVAFDGQVPLFEVDALERTVRKSGAGAAATATAPAGAPRARRIAVPADGGVTLRVGSTTQPYQGRMDGLVLRGVFRLRDDVVTLPAGLTFDVLQPAKAPLPLYVRYANGRLDTAKHPQDVVIQVRDTVRVDDLPLVLELGRSGLVRADLGAPPELTPAAGTGESR